MDLKITALPTELLRQEIVGRLDPVSSFSLSLTSKSLRALAIDFTGISKTQELNYWKAIFGEPKWERIEVGVLHPSIFLLSACLSYGLDGLFRHLISSFGFKTLFGYKDCYFLSILMIARNKADLLDWFLAQRPLTVLSVDDFFQNNDGILFKYFARALGVSGNVDLCLKYMRHLDSAESIIQIAIGAAQGGHLLILEFDSLRDVFLYESNETHLLCLYSCLAAAISTGTRSNRPRFHKTSLYLYTLHTIY